jgi:hypothetical protein
MKLRVLISMVMIHAVTLAACGVDEGQTHDQEVKVESTSRSNSPAKHGGRIGDPGPQKADPSEVPRPRSADGGTDQSHTCKGRPKERVNTNPEICREYLPAD